MKKTRAFAVFSALLIANSQAAVWQIGQVNASQGANVVVPISLIGDGATTGAQIKIRFDNARLSLPIANGVLVGAGVNGAICARNELNAITVLTGFSNSVIPSTSTVLCNIPFTVVASASGGRAQVQGNNAECYNVAGLSQACTVQQGGVQVTAPIVVQPARPAIPKKRVFFLLSNAPTAPTLAQVTATNFSAGQLSILAGLRTNGIRSVSRSAAEAKGDALAYVTANPTLPEAILQRYGTVDIQMRPMPSRA